MKPTARDLEQAFINCEDTFPESARPIHVRWAEIYHALPPFRGKSLTDDLTPIWQALEATGSRSEVLRACDLAMLQSRFYVILAANKLIPTHVQRCVMENSLLWQRRFADRLQNLKAAQRTNGRIRKGKKPPLEARPWIN